MSSPSSPTSSASTGSNMYGQQPNLEQLVDLFVAAKRSLSITDLVWRANEIVNSGRDLLEQNAVLAAKNAFARGAIEEQVDALEAISYGIELLLKEGKADFNALLKTVDAAQDKLKTVLNALKNTPIEPCLQPPNTPPKQLYDFIDSNSLTDMYAQLYASIDRTNEAQNSLGDTLNSLDASLKDIMDHLSQLPVSSNPPSPSPLPPTFRELETHATESAELLQSLVRHYDMCLTAIKHTEGGYTAVQAADTREEALPDNLTADFDDAPPPPLTASSLTDLIAVLIKDSAEVDDVVHEIRSHLQEMEDHLDSMTQHVDGLRSEYSTLLFALGVLKKEGAIIPTHISASQAFCASWDEEKANLVRGMAHLGELREFYEGFQQAYWKLLVEVGRRREAQLRMEKIAKEAKDRIDGIYQEDLGEREAFWKEQGEFLPADIWSGLTVPPLRYQVSRVDAEGQETGESVPDISKQVLERALQRTKKGRVGRTRLQVDDSRQY